jgi:hypothetical protein
VAVTKVFFRKLGYRKDNLSERSPFKKCHHHNFPETLRTATKKNFFFALCVTEKVAKKVLALTWWHGTGEKRTQ